MDRIDVLFRIIERYDNYIEVANNKANYVLAFVVSLSVAVTALLGYSEVLQFKLDSAFLNILKVLSLLAFLVNLFYLMRILFGIHNIIFPNTSSPKHLEKSKIFFGDVASLDHESYAASVINMSSEDFELDLSFQVSALAKIVDEKFKFQKDVMAIVSRQYIGSALVMSVLCGIVKSMS